MCDRQLTEWEGVSTPDPSSPVMYRVALLGPEIAHRQVDFVQCIWARCFYINHGQHYLAVLCYRDTELCI